MDTVTLVVPFTLGEFREHTKHMSELHVTQEQYDCYKSLLQPQEITHPLNYSGKRLCLS